LVQLHPDPSTAPFWAAAAEHRLLCQRCADCGTRRMPPGPVCAVCQSTASAWDELSGRATLYTYTVVRHALMPEMAGHLPHVIAAVELDDAPGIRLVSNVVEVNVEDLAIGLPLEIVWDDVEEAVSVYRFRPLGDHAGAKGAPQPE
jgi:uncharacterized OB-fold protein